MGHRAQFAAAFLFIGSLAATQVPPGPVQAPLITTERLPQAVVGEPYPVKLDKAGGVPPFKWTLVEGRLPRGLGLDEATGEFSGAPEQAGEFKFTVQLADSVQPSRSAQREFRLLVLAQLRIEWKQFPSVQGSAVGGSVQISNNTADPVDLTVIIVAVNEIDKAFALGYQHFTMQPRTANLPISFSSTLPPGQYVVHADAVGEAAVRNAIYRARLQTPAPLVMP